MCLLHPLAHLHSSPGDYLAKVGVIADDWVPVGVPHLGLEGWVGIAGATAPQMLPSMLCC